jgi:P27 family predicted phage terminase small subunit
VAGRRGRPVKPTKLKVIAGTLRKHRANPREPEPPTGAVCPEWLAEDGRREWARLAPWLEGQGLLTIADQAAYAGYCAAFARWRRFEQLAQQAQPALAIKAGYANAATKALQQLHGYLSLFGLSPSDRARVSAEPPKGSKLGTFLKGGRPAS